MPQSDSYPRELKKMSKMNTSFGFAAALILVFASASANAQATRTWVSGVGDDVNPCSRTAPCKTFAGAISKTAKDGEISVLDPGGFGQVTITKSITINGTPGAGYGSILVTAAGTGVIINITDPNDIRRQVRLNWLDINGASTAANGIRILNTGLANSVVIVENSVIDGMTTRGISDERASGGKLFVNNTMIRNIGQSGIVTLPSSGSTKIDSLISNSQVKNAAGAGVAINNGGKSMIVNSAFSGGNIGIDAEGAGTEVTADHVTVSSNNTGFFTGSGGVIRLSNSNVSFNTTGVNGTVNSFTNNQFVSSPGGTITPIGSPTNATGWQ